jgi:hypothetical protein
MQSNTGCEDYMLEWFTGNTRCQVTNCSSDNREKSGAMLLEVFMNVIPAEVEEVPIVFLL